MQSSKHQHNCYAQGEEQEQSQCPECGNRYSESSSQQQQEQSSGSNQRILIPIKRDLLQKNMNQSDLQILLQNFQKQISALKSENISKDRMIENLKRQMEQKIAHYALYGQINRQNQEINRLRNQIQFAAMNQNFNNTSRKNLPSEGDLPLINRMKRNSSVDVEYGFNFNTKQNIKHPFRDDESSSSFGNGHNFASAYDLGKNNHLIHSLQKHKTIPSKISLQARINTERSKFLQKQSHQPMQPKSIFKISEAKKKIEELQKLVRYYEQEFIWLKNFVNSFIKTMQKIGSKKHSEKIFLEKWGLKKKAKACWRYLKHLLQYLYQE